MPIPAGDVNAILTHEAVEQPTLTQSASEDSNSLPRLRSRVSESRRGGTAGREAGQFDQIFETLKIDVGPSIRVAIEGDCGESLDRCAAEVPGVVAYKGHIAAGNCMARSAAR